MRFRRLKPSFQRLLGGHQPRYEGGGGDGLAEAGVSIEFGEVETRDFVYRSNGVTFGGLVDFSSCFGLEGPVSPVLPRTL